MTLEMPSMKNADLGIKRTLHALIGLASQKRDDPRIHELALELTAREPNRDGKVRALVDEISRRFVYAPDPTKVEFIGPVPLTRGEMIDVDDACLFVAALAMSVDIPCRIVGARYGYVKTRSGRYGFWTCILAYENEDGFWTAVDPLKQKFDTERLKIEELMYVD